MAKSFAVANCRREWTSSLQLRTCERMQDLHHVKKRDIRPTWRRWLGLSEVWVRGDLSSRLLVSLRWVAAAGQVVTLVAVWRLGVAVAWLPCGIAIGSTVFSNAVLSWWLRQLRRGLGDGFFHIALLDSLTLTLLLYWTGGLMNPFSLFYLVQLTLAAVALRTSAAVSLAGAMAAACGFLQWRHVPLNMASGSAVPPHLFSWGHATAIILAGAFILVLLVAIRRRSHRLQIERGHLRQELEARDRFLSVATLATGFAHEIATPLGTIMLVVEQMMAESSSAAIELVAHETARCQEVLGRLRELGQEAKGSATPPCKVMDTVNDVLADLSTKQRERVHLTASDSARNALVACPGLREALLVLLRNALLSSGKEFPVVLDIRSGGRSVHFGVEDRGPGFTEDMLKHWGEPFRSTRDQGAGMGLGLFFVRRLAASMRGVLDVGNLPHGGARVVLSLPLYLPFYGDS